MQTVYLNVEVYKTEPIKACRTLHSYKYEHTKLSIRKTVIVITFGLAGIVIFLRSVTTAFAFFVDEMFATGREPWVILDAG
jgi:hypothetical protein